MTMIKSWVKPKPDTHRTEVSQVRREAYTQKWVIRDRNDGDTYGQYIRILQEQVLKGYVINAAAQIYAVITKRGKSLTYIIFTVNLCGE